MKRNATISLIMALLMILSILVIATPSGAQDVKFEVIKEVYDGEDYVDSIEAEYGNIVQFRITTTYNGKYCAEDILVTDNLPNCLEYIGTIQPESKKPVISGNTIVWDFEEITLLEGEQFTIEFNAKVVGFGENVNSVNVTAYECCTNAEMYDEDTATVIVNPSVEVKKKVWDPDTGKWAPQLDYVIKGQKVRFQIAITYHGEDQYTMKCMVVKDNFLSAGECICLDYADNVKITYPSTNFDPPKITVSEDLKSVEFNWTKSRFNLYNGESIAIEFDANVTDYCPEGFSVINHVFVDIWSCDCCNHLYGSDNATVYCIPHEPIFDKKVYNGKEYVGTADVFVNDTIKYKIDLTYYGINNLTDIRIMDELSSCVLEHVDGNAKLTISRGEGGLVAYIKGNISENKKVARWDIAEELKDGYTLSLEFNVLVTGETACGENKASYTAYSDGNDYSGNDTAYITSIEKPLTEIDINLNRISLGRVHGKICNQGETDLSNVKCIITVKGGIFKRVDLTVTEEIETIAAGGCALICTGKRSLKRAFGRINVNVTVIVGDETYTETFKGVVRGRIVLRLK